MALQEDIENFTTTVEDAVSYPILTRDASDYPSSRNGSSSSSGNGITATTRTAKQTIRDVLGWRYRSDDAKGFLAALNKSFSLKEVEGHIVSEWKAQSYMVQADLGEITGAQASVYKQASVALENALPLLDGLTPLRTDADAEDTEAMRAIIRTEMTELVGELGITGGPRVQRVDLFFEKLIGPLNPTPSFDPEYVRGQLARLQQRFGLTRARVNTITEEQNLTNFLILVDYINGLYQSWDSKRGYFDGSAEPFLGTQLVLISEVLDAILEQLQETYDAMDSVFFGPAERQTTEIDLGVGKGSLSVAEILSWVENFASTEGRQLIQDGGKDGVVVFNSTIIRLTDIVQTAADIAALPSTNPVRPFHTRRVALSLAELASYLSTAKERASQISRKTMCTVEEKGNEENQWWLAPTPAKTSIASALVTHVEWTARKSKSMAAWSPREPKDRIVAGDQVKVEIFGLHLRPPLALDLGSDITVDKINHDRRDNRAIVTITVADAAKTGWRDLRIKGGANQKPQTVSRALTIDEPIQQQQAQETSVSKMTPACGHQGDSLHVTLIGKSLRGSAVSFGPGIVPKGIAYPDDDTMKAQIVIDRHAEIGEHTVTVFTPHCQTVSAPKFRVVGAKQSPDFEVTTREAPAYIDPCSEDGEPPDYPSGGGSQTPKYPDTPTGSPIEKPEPSDYPSGWGSQTPKYPDTPTGSPIEKPEPPDYPSGWGSQTPKYPDTPTGSPIEKPEPPDYPSGWGSQTPKYPGTPTGSPIEKPEPPDYPSGWGSQTPKYPDTPTELPIEKPEPPDNSSGGSSQTPKYPDTPTELPIEKPEPPDNSLGGSSQTAKSSPIPTTVPEKIRSSLKAVMQKAGQPTVMSYSEQTLGPRAFEFRKGMDPRVEVTINPGQSVKSAWLASSGTPAKILKCKRKQQKGNHVKMQFESPPSKAPREYDLFKFMNDDSCERVPNAVIFK